eukprot:6786209-Prorocentrum_lima.AAC.1
MPHQRNVSGVVPPPVPQQSKALLPSAGPGAFGPRPSAASVDAAHPQAQAPLTEAVSKLGVDLLQGSSQAVAEQLA